MNLPLILTPKAREEVDDAYQWYQQQQEGLGEEFLAALDLVYDRISTTPKMHALVYRNIRRANVKKFHYSVYYQVEAELIRVQAVQHDRRNPASWMVRI